MGSRKRVKPNPAAEPNTPSASPNPLSMMPSLLSSKSSKSHTSVAENANSGAIQTPPTPTDAPNAARGSKPGDNSRKTATPKQVRKTSSWYGSWPRVPKSSASTQVARETILGGTSKPKATADLSRFEPRKTPDSMSIYESSSSAPSQSKTQEDGVPPAEGQPDNASPTAEGVVDANNEVKPEDVDMKDATNANGGRESDQNSEQATDSPAEQQQLPPGLTPEKPASGGWFGWLGWTANPEPAVQDTASTSSQTKPAELSPIPEPAAEGHSTVASVKASAPEIKPAEQNQETQPGAEGTEPADSPDKPTMQQKAATPSRSSWLWYWSTRTDTVASQSKEEPAAEQPGASPPSREPEDVVMEEAPPVKPASEPSAPPAKPVSEPPAPPPKAGSTWAFWSRDTRSAVGKEQTGNGEQGQLVVMGESSEAHPKRANSVEFRGAPTKEAPLKTGKKDGQARSDTTPSREESLSSKKSKQARTQSMEIDGAAPAARPSTPKTDTAPKPAAAKTPIPAKALPPNLLLPSFRSTYRLKDNPSIIKQITQLLLRTQQPAAKHVYLRKDPPKLKKAIAIGVHGLFPANYLRPMIGQPTGTSIKFANHCAEAIRRWADAHGCGACEIEKVALEGEGRIAERVENLWKLLLNWIEHIRAADLVMVACHSQGVPVSVMLVAKLIEFGVVTAAKVGICAMAGVSLGPFPDYRSSMGILMGSAAELWEFADPQSDVSKRLEASVKVVLGYGARITYVGSIDDQLVPLESAIYAPVHHPYIYRAVFIDGRIHAPDFIAHLVGFALKLRNLGVSDHGLIRELSTPLAGSLYSGEGHSRLYDDEQVYDLAVQHALETTDVAGTDSASCVEVQHRPKAGALSNPNPYHLPWIMRGVLEEDFVKTELSAETAELVRQFDDWKPVTKALKDVKYRLEAVRSKL
ncbi:hypothetical protein VTK26DRAFT_439 [Humicola hyalothermophila]